MRAGALLTAGAWAAAGQARAATGPASGWTVAAQSSGIPSGFPETSGLAASQRHPGVYGVGDSASAAALYWFTPKPGSQTAFNGRRIPITGASNLDWECIKYSLESFDGGQTWLPFLYIHDNMGNGSDRPKRLIKVREPDNPNTATAARIDWIGYWRWPAGLPTGTCGNIHNTEAIAIHNRRLYAVRKRQGSAAEVGDVGPLASLSRREDSPTVAKVMGTIGHPCPSEFALSADRQLLITVSHGLVRVWRSKVGGGTVEAFLTGNNELLFEHRPAPVDGASNSTESATWWPWDSKDFLVVSESRSTYRYTRNPVG